MACDPITYRDAAVLEGHARRNRKMRASLG